MLPLPDGLSWNISSLTLDWDLHHGPTGPQNYTIGFPGFPTSIQQTVEFLGLQNCISQSIIRNLFPIPRE